MKMSSISLQVGPAGAPSGATAAASSTTGLGDLPEWNLSDLYPGMDAPELQRDIARANSDSVAFEAAWKGRIAEAARAARTADWAT